jgi:hypothetical protein
MFRHTDSLFKTGMTCTFFEKNLHSSFSDILGDRHDIRGGYGFYPRINIKEDLSSIWHE